MIQIPIKILMSGMNSSSFPSGISKRRKVDSMAISKTPIKKIPFGQPHFSVVNSLIKTMEINDV